ncbi:MAG: hypothetical protein ACI841_000877 [Planctomycetota bacterium]|jgi:hypothetical protein
MFRVSRSLNIYVDIIPSLELSEQSVERVGCRSGLVTLGWGIGLSHGGCEQWFFGGR